MPKHLWSTYIVCLRFPEDLKLLIKRLSELIICIIILFYHMFLQRWLLNWQNISLWIFVCQSDCQLPSRVLRYVFVKRDRMPFRLDGLTSSARQKWWIDCHISFNHIYWPAICNLFLPTVCPMVVRRDWLIAKYLYLFVSCHLYTGRCIADTKSWLIAGKTEQQFFPHLRLPEFFVPRPVKGRGEGALGGATAFQS